MKENEGANEGKDSNAPILSQKSKTACQGVKDNNKLSSIQANRQCGEP